MSWIWTTPGGWLFRSVVGGGVLLLLTWVLVRRTRQPARRQRLGEWGVGVALLLAILNLGPAWIPVVRLPVNRDAGLQPTSNPPRPPLMTENPRKERGASFAPMTPVALGEPFEGEPSQSGDLVAIVNEQHDSEKQSQPQDNGVSSQGIEDFAPAPHANSAPATQVGPKHLANANSSTPNYPEDSPRASVAFSAFLSLGIMIPVVAIVYGIGAAIHIGRWLLGYLALKQLLKAAEPAPRRVRRLFAEIAGRGRRPRLLVSSRLRVPLSCGLFRPTIVLPASMLKGLGELTPPAQANPAQEARLRWVFAHELTHLKRRDAWSCLLFGLGQGLYFFWPWFWWLRRQVRLCQEYIADAAVVRQVGSAEDYAEFLLSMTSAPAVPVSATGVMGNSSDLFRRVTMLLKTPKRMERTGSWKWTLAMAGGLLAVAVLASGIGPRAMARAGLDNVKKDAGSADKTAPQEEKKEAPKAPQPPPAPGAAGFARFPFGNDNNNANAMMQMMQRAQWMGGFGFGGQIRLGVRIAVPNAALADQLDLPKDQGLVIDQVTPDSPAAKGGLKNNDILLEFNGKPVPSNPNEFIRQVHEIKADTKVDAVVLRKGKRETIKGLTLPEEKQAGFGAVAAPPGGFPAFGGAQPGAGFGGAFPGAGGFAKPIPNPVDGMMGFATNNNTVMLTVTRTNDHFTTRHQEGTLVITLTGPVADGKAKTNKIHVQDGQVTHDYESLDKVPDQYKDKVKNLVTMMDNSNFRIEIKTQEPKPEAKPEAK